MTHSYLVKCSTNYTTCTTKSRVWVILRALTKLPSTNFKMHQPPITQIDNLTIVTYEPHDVQPQPSQVFNFDEVLFGPNGRWGFIVCAYNCSNYSCIWCS